MQKLLSEIEIKKQGYKKVSDRVYFKAPNQIYYKCRGCGSWTNTSRKPVRNKVNDNCFWCLNNFTLFTKNLK